MFNATLKVNTARAKGSVKSESLPGSCMDLEVLLGCNVHYCHRKGDTDNGGKISHDFMSVLLFLSHI